MAAAMLGSVAFARTCTDDARIDVVPNEPIGPVTGALYGHLIEHLGGVIYDGVWVNGGLRQLLVDDLRALTPGIVRWPGGCFADSYDWKDGIGDPTKRPRRGSFWGGTESNAFGTPEFMRLCRAIGAEPYLAVNGRGRTAQDWAEWVDYCNATAGSTTLADQRAADGSRSAYAVQYWGIGNEPWGCGGQLTPEEYAEEYRRFSAWVPTFPGSAVKPRLIAAGPSDSDDAWTRRFLESLAAGHGQPPFGLSVHSYFFLDRDLTFTSDGWYQAMAKPRALGAILDRQAALLRAASAPVKLVLDEWGDWYRERVPGTNPAHLFEGIPTMRDALVTTLMFDVFHAHADVLAIAAVAQLVNCIHSLFLTEGAQYVRTPIYHAFALYQPHIGGTAVRTVVSEDRLSASATVRDPGRLVLTVTNTSLDQPVAATVRVRGAASATRITYTLGA
jgi:alpha-N-arabinofuranosidase